MLRHEQSQLCPRLSCPAWRRSSEPLFARITVGMTDIAGDLRKWGPA
jgi:hypothetical protein